MQIYVPGFDQATVLCEREKRNWVYTGQRDSGSQVLLLGQTQVTWFVWPGKRHRPEKLKQVFFVTLLHIQFCQFRFKEEATLWSDLESSIKGKNKSIKHGQKMPKPVTVFGLKGQQWGEFTPFPEPDLWFIYDWVLEPGRCFEAQLLMIKGSSKCFSKMLSFSFKHINILYATLSVWRESQWWRGHSYVLGGAGRSKLYTLKCVHIRSQITVRWNW